MFKELTPTFVGIGIFIAAITFFSSIYIVDETEQVFVTRFGEIVRQPINAPGTKDEAGYYFCVPFVDKIRSFEKRHLEWDGKPNEVTTKDKKFIYIDTYARWRIVDAKIFYKNLGEVSFAKLRLNGILDGAVRNIVAANDLGSDDQVDLVGSGGLLEIVVRDGSATAEIGLQRGDAVTVEPCR